MFFIDFLTVQSKFHIILYSLTSCSDWSTGSCASDLTSARAWIDGNVVKGDVSSDAVAPDALEHDEVGWAVWDVRLSQHPAVTMVTGLVEETYKVSSVAGVEVHIQLAYTCNVESHRVRGHLYIYLSF